MKISTNGKRNITLDFNAPKKFRLVKDGAEIPYIRTGKNSFRLSKPVDGFVELEEVIEQPRYMQPVQLQPQQMTVINPQDVDRLNEAVRQMALVNPQDVMIINQTAEQLEKNQNFIAQTQKEITDNQVYIDQQQQRLNETALGIQALETDNSQRLDGAENAILNLAGEISNTQNMAVDGMNTALNKIEEQGILLQTEIDAKADKDELESLRKDFEEKSDQFSNAMSNYSGGYAYDTLPRDGEAGQILAKRTDRQGDYVWINQTPVIVKSKTMPTASEKYKDEVYQYVGETGDYTHGYIYECQQNGTSYDWVRLDVQPNTAVWGQITGTLSNQTDLQEALNLKANKSYVDSQDNNLQQQIDAITAASDVTDIVGTYAQLQAYDTSTLPNNSIIKVLQDESRNNETTYYRWVITGGVGAWVLIGEEGPYYTKSETNTLLTAKQDTLVSGTNIKTVNGASLLGGGNLSVAGDINPYISNCITEIPQDIKLEIIDDSFVLKSGSKLTTGDGTQYTTTSDYTINVGSPTGQRMVLITRNTTGGFLGVVVGISGTNIFSGNTAPTVTTQTAYWYDTTNMIIKRTQDTGSTWSTIAGSDICLPIGLVTFSSGSAVSIDQVFNGFGYIGSTVFALPNVRGLIPNGRNADGTLKSIEFKNTKVATNEITGTRDNYQIRVWKNAIRWGLEKYNEKDNVNIFLGDNSIKQETIAGNFSSNNGVITSFTTKPAFHAVDYNDFSYLSDKVNTNTSNITTLQNTKQDEATAVNYDNISNCITEIPQDIKLELNNGTLTLKAGSKVYKLDGTSVTINSDVSLSTSGYGFNQQCLIYYSPLNNSLETPNVAICFSGSGYPTITTYQYMLYFDTTAKTYYWTNDNGTSWTERVSNSYPIAIATIGESSWQSIDQVFNGFGYIGSTVFALPGVKGLIPNGRNADGSLKNVELILTSVKILNFAYSNQPLTPLVLSTDVLTANRVYTYNEKINYIYESHTGAISRDRFICGRIATNSSSQISLLEIKTAFHAVDYNDFNNLTINVLKAIYPVGAVYIGTTSTCPLASFFGTWTLKSTGIVTSVDSNVPVKGNGKALGLTDGSTDYSLGNDTGTANGRHTCLYEIFSNSSLPATSSNATISTNNALFGVNTDDTKSGIVGTVTRSTLSVNIWERTA